MKIIKRITTATMVLGLGLPTLAFGAYNDVTLTTDTVINVAGINLNVSGTSATMQSITVGASSFSFVLESGSSLQVTSNDRKILTTDAPAKYIETDTCNASASIMKYSSSAASVTVTVTPTTETCSNSSSSGSSRGGGGGGGGGGTTLPKTPATPTPAPQALANAAPQAVFNRLLSVGSTGDDVKALQVKLIAEGLLKAQVTGYFGPLTKAAVKAYQAKYGISQLGIVGPATRAQLNKGAPASPASSAAPASVSALMTQINALLKQVQELQAKLKAKGN